MPQKRRRRRRRSPGRGSSRRRIGQELPGSVVEADISSTNSVADGGASLPYYQSIISSRLARLEFPPSADGDDPYSFDCPDLPSGEILETLTRRSFLDTELLDALVEYQVQKCSTETHGQDSREFRLASESHGRDSGEFHSADVAMVPVDSGDVISDEDFLKDVEKLRCSVAPAGTLLDEQEQDELYLRHARFRIKAFLLLTGKAIDKLDDAALERKYPQDLIAKHSYFLNLEYCDLFGWYFDPDFCKLASLTDYQRLVLFNDYGYEYDNWSRYQSFYNTPETDRDYLLYWEAMTENIKWIENYIHRGRNSDEWEDIWTKAKYQAIRIATAFDNIHVELACLGFVEFEWSTRNNVLFQKDLDGLFFEIWKRVKEQGCFREALEDVFQKKMFPSRALCMKDELDGNFRMEEQFRKCTVGITKKVPEYKARELIAQQVKNKLVLTHGYQQYAEKKLKIAEFIGLIPKGST